MPNPRTKLGKLDLSTMAEENERLRAALNLEKTSDIEQWGAFAPQDIRDRMAAQALILEKLDAPRALRRLGFDVRMNGNRYEPIVWEWCTTVFNTPGVKAQLAVDMTDAEKNKQEIIARMVSIARHGTDGDSVRATQQLAKMADWNEGDKAVAKAGAARISTFMQLVSGDDGSDRRRNEAPDPDAVIDAKDFLAHEPTGEIVAVADDEPVALNR